MVGNNIHIIIYFDDLLTAAISISEHNGIIPRVIQRAKSLNNKFISKEINII